MRRQYKGRTDAMVKSQEGEQGFWPSYADMMSAVALILFFLMLLSYISNMITGNNLRNTEDLLATTRAQVEEALEEYRKAQADAARVRAEYDNAQLELQGLTQDLSQKQSELDSKQAELDSYAVQIRNQTDMLRQQEKQISEQKAYLAAADNEIVTLRSQMTTVAALRLSILKQITDNLVDVIGDASKVSIGDNGNIILSEGVFFDLGSSALKPESLTVLNELIDYFAEFLSEFGDNCLLLL